MNPIPITWCAAGGLALTVVGFGAGWTVQDWRRDSEALAQSKAATKSLNEATQRIDKASSDYEQGKQDAVTQNTVRENTIRTIYKDRVVSSDCAVPDAAAGVLKDAVAAANARASGEHAATMPTATGAAKPAN